MFSWRADADAAANTNTSNTNRRRPKWSSEKPRVQSIWASAGLRAGETSSQIHLPTTSAKVVLLRQLCPQAVHDRFRGQATIDLMF